jgi:hypothetical protein
MALTHSLTFRRQLPNANSGILDKYDGARFQRVASLSHRDAKSLPQIRLTRQSEPQQDHPTAGLANETDDLAEIEIECHDDPTVFGGPNEDFAIRQIAVSSLPHMDRVMSFGPQPIRYCRRQIHVEKKAHPTRFRPG